MLRRNYGLELGAWFLLPFMLAGIQGGSMGVVLKKTFTGVPGLTDATVDFAVACLAASTAVGNLTSGITATLANGRRKVPFLFGLMVATSCCVGLRDAPHIHFRRVARILPRVTRRTGAGSENRRRALPREEKRGHALRCACYSYRCSDGVEGLGASHPSIFRRDMSGCQLWRTAG